MAQTKNERDTTKQAIQQMVDRRECVNCGKSVADKDSYKRGLCQACYQMANRAVHANVTTWSELESRNHAVPATKGGRKSKKRSDTPLGRFIEAAEAEKNFTDAKAIAQSKRKQ